MGDIDLIPALYRKQRRQKVQLRLLMIIIIIVILGILSAVALLKVSNKGLISDIEQLQVQKSVSAQMSERLQIIRNKKNQLEKQQALLEKLRGGVSVSLLFELMDKAIFQQNVWFLNWQFQRGGLSNRNANNNRSSKGQTLEANRNQNTNMILRGRADEHDDVSNFVAQLIAQHEIEKVQILTTELKESGRQKFVQFELAILVSQSE